MVRHREVSDRDLGRKIREQEIRFGGNLKLKIYGTLSCGPGKRMKRENSAFFASEKEALQNYYRPCGHCMKEQYQKWKSGFI